MDNFIASSGTELLFIFASIILYGFYKMIKAVAATEASHTDSQNVLNSLLAPLQADFRLLQEEHQQAMNKMLVLQTRVTQLEADIKPLEEANKKQHQTITEQNLTITALNRQLMDCKDQNGLHA